MSTTNEYDVKVIAKVRSFLASYLKDHYEPNEEAVDILVDGYHEMAKCLKVVVNRLSKQSDNVFVVDELRRQYKYDDDDDEGMNEVMDSEDLLYCLYTLLVAVRRCLKGKVSSTCCEC